MAYFNSTQSDWCGIIQDDSFGPTVNGCRDDFDFTLLFEEAILAVVPSAIFLLLLSPRLVQLWRSQKMVRSSFLQLLKSVSEFRTQTYDAPCQTVLPENY
jgi:ATP-binding cassette subfamily C (CFTR/MRP) protein 1